VSETGLDHSLMTTMFVYSPAEHSWHTAIMRSGVVIFMVRKPPNVQGERREAVAADVRFVSELNGCLPFAPPCGLDGNINVVALLV
jgi:hypothetical protein